MKNNTGNYNTGNRNTGYCNSIKPTETLIFNKKALFSDWEKAVKPQWMHVSLIEWVVSDNMTEKEKEAYPSYVTTGGYLKVFSSLKHAYVESWEKASIEDKKKTFKLPNFDIKVFEEVFGFIPVVDDKKLITIDGKDVYISEDSYNELKKQLT